MPRARRVCSRPGCPTLTTTTSRCQPCTREADTARGTAAQRGYTSSGHQQFREAVLARDPICKLCRRTRSTVADHHPVSRRDLETQGLDPNDPTRGRGLCKPCHDRSTAREQPGGWNTSGDAA
jgi:5-methylcytosine-specific restriction protein A